MIHVPEMNEMDENKLDHKQGILSRIVYDKRVKCNLHG